MWQSLVWLQPCELEESRLIQELQFWTHFNLSLPCCFEDPLVPTKPEYSEGSARFKCIMGPLGRIWSRDIWPRCIRARFRTCLRQARWRSIADATSAPSVT